MKCAAYDPDIVDVKMVPNSGACTEYIPERDECCGGSATVEITYTHGGAIRLCSPCYLRRYVDEKGWPCWRSLIVEFQEDRQFKRWLGCSMLLAFPVVAAVLTYAVWRLFL